MRAKTYEERASQDLLVERLESRAWWVLPIVSVEAIALSGALWRYVGHRDEDMSVLCACCGGGTSVALVRKQAVPKDELLGVMVELFEIEQRAPLTTEDVLIITGDEDPLGAMHRASDWARWVQDGLTPEQLGVLEGRHN